MNDRNRLQRTLRGEPLNLHMQLQVSLAFFFLKESPVNAPNENKISRKRILKEKKLFFCLLQKDVLPMLRRSTTINQFIFVITITVNIKNIYLPDEIKTI